MNDGADETGRRVAETIQGRVGAGQSDLVAGWQGMLAELLEKMGPFLSAGRLVTFRTLLPEEKTFFEGLVQTMTVPDHVTALYISPSVRQQMMGDGPGSGALGRVPARVSNPPDAGIVLACRENDHRIIVNALFAHPPHTPAIDIYENGQLIAGYSYASQNACRGEINAVLQRHLGSRG